MSNLFREYVTSTAFKLSLSKVQIECISQIDQIGGSWMMLSTYNALAAKGLVERIAPATGADHPAGCSVRLTDAGRAVITLLKLAGLYQEIPKWEPPAPMPDLHITVKRKPNWPATEDA
jgi:hypothetical protein